MSKWFKNRRLEWIRETVNSSGSINRSQLEDTFDIGTAQASNDFRDAMTAWPDLMHYDKSLKRYVRKDDENAAS